MGIEIVESTAGEAEAKTFSFWSHYNEVAKVPWSYRRAALVAREGDQTRGVLVYSICGGVAHLGQVIVDPASQGRGIASSLVAQFELICVREGSHRITLEVADFQAPAFFEKLGYERRAQFDNDKYNATWFRYDKALPASALAK